MRSILGTCLIGFLAFLFLTTAVAQLDVDRPPPDIEGLLERAGVQQPTPNQPLVTRTTPSCNVYEGKLKEACEQALGARFVYESARLDHRRRSFEWSLSANKVIFAVVVVLVFAGLLLAAVQFASGMGYRLGRRDDLAAAEPPPDKVDKAAPLGSMEIELGLDRLKVTSSVLGVIILALSMGFFYLYVLYVYPITQVGTGS